MQSAHIEIRWGSGHCIGPFVAAGVAFIVLAIVETKVAKEPVGYTVLL